MPDEYLESAIADLDKLLAITAQAEVNPSASPKWSEVGELLEAMKAEAQSLKTTLEQE